MANHERPGPNPVILQRVKRDMAEAILEEAVGRPEVRIVMRRTPPGNQTTEISGGSPFYLDEAKRLKRSDFVNGMVFADEVKVFEDK